MTINSPITIAGRAVYFEFVKNDATTQVLLMPEGETSSHKTVTMVAYHRRITRMSSRKTWKVSSAYVAAKSLIGAPSFKSPSEAVSDTLSFLMPLFASIERNSYVLHKQPIVVEVTPEDLQQSLTGTTPYKVLARVNKSRKALGFPKETIFSVNDGIIMYPLAPVSTPAF